MRVMGFAALVLLAMMADGTASERTECGSALFRAGEDMKDPEEGAAYARQHCKVGSIIAISMRRAIFAALLCDFDKTAINVGTVVYCVLRKPD